MPRLISNLTGIYLWRLAKVGAPSQTPTPSAARVVLLFIPSHSVQCCLRSAPCCWRLFANGLEFTARATGLTCRTPCLGQAFFILGYQCRHLVQTTVCFCARYVQFKDDSRLSGPQCPQLN